MQMSSAAGGQLPAAVQSLRARIDYERDGTILFRLDGHDAPRFASILAALRSTIPVAEREWRADLSLWVIDAGWDDELIEILEDHCERADILVSGLPLDKCDEEEPREEELTWPILRTTGPHGWLDLDDLPPPILDRRRLGHLIIPDCDESRDNG